MNFKQFIGAVIFALATVMLYADGIQVKLEFVENGPLGSDMRLQFTNASSTDVVFSNMERDIYEPFLVLAANSSGDLIRCKRWKKIEPVKVPPKRGYLAREGRVGFGGRSLNLPRNSSKESFALLLSLVDIPCFQPHYVMFVLRDKTRFYTTNILGIERTAERFMKQISSTAAEVPEAVLKTFTDEIKLLYEEECLKPVAE
ncbi:hypothetical protein MASR1M12_28470 [Erysipelotrichia bacterium]